MSVTFARPFRWLTHRRSNGVPVPLFVARLIQSGNRARGEGDWAKAERAYRAAVTRMPGLRHIWIQAGHAGKETGDLSAAAEAYSRAAALGTDDPEPHIHLGHVTKLAGRSAEAAQHYYEALRRRPDSLAAAAELMRTADADTVPGRELIDKAIALVGLDETSRRLSQTMSAKRTYFDVTDLLAYFSHARLPTGIQRVQIELVCGALEAASDSLVGICCFSDVWKGWRELDRDRFLRVATASLTDDDREDPTWRREVISTLLELIAGPKINFDQHSILVNVGSSWSERNYFLNLRNARDAGGPLYIPLIYDLIPMRHPEWFPAALVRDYRVWIREIFAHADAFLAISNATATDLRRVDSEINAGRPAADVGVIALNGDFRSPLRDGADDSALARWRLKPENFVLMVSTIEPRKNHLGIFRAWQKLIARMPADKVPPLVCVGGRGWMNEQVHALLASDAKLRDKVLLLHGVPDADLALLYRRCLLTTYPSFYEGWGLPITESLCYGKVPVVSRGSSMPEAGGRFAVYFDPTDANNMADVLQSLIENPEERTAKEVAISADFHPTAWSAIAEQLLADVRKVAVHDGAPRAPFPETAGRLSFSADTPETAVSGEQLRHGTGWAPPGPEGAGILAQCATLRLPENRRRNGSPVKLRLTNRSKEIRRVTICVDDDIEIDTSIHGQSSLWIALPSTFRAIRKITLADSGFRVEQTGMGRAEAALLVSEIAFEVND